MYELVWERDSPNIYYKSFTFVLDVQHNMLNICVEHDAMMHKPYSVLHIHDISGWKVNILGCHSIGISNKKSVHMSYSELLPR
jgi:hypothetical protein